MLLPAFLPAKDREKSKQEKTEEDSLARLVRADTLQVVEIRGVSYRKVKGNAAFLHNNTYLLCDSALWNVDSKVIEAMGSVRLEQDRTVLSSDHLTYYPDRDLAEFRGSIVQLIDKDNNTLRTKYLDYNTKDSVAIFRNGGAMRDKDGQIVEGLTGTYDAKLKSFTFSEDVNMFSDTLFVKTSYLKYDSDPNLATFGYATHAWRNGDMLSANSGWYDRGNELFLFTRQVHLTTADQEAWGDSLYFHRATNDVTLLGNAQVNDTTRNVFALGGSMDYVDSLGRLTLTREPAVICETEEKDENGRTKTDSLYFGADTIVYRTIKKCEIDSTELAAAQARLKSVDNDPITEHRKQAAEAARKAAEEAAADDPNNPENAKKRAEEAAKAKEGAAKDAEAVESPMSRHRKKKASSSKGSESSSGADQLGNDAVRDSIAVVDSTAAWVEEIADQRGNGAELTDSLAVADTLALTDSQVVADTLAMTDSLAVTDTLAMTDSLAVADTLASTTDSLAVADSLAMEPLDTTKIGFLEAHHNVRAFRQSLQLVCDSLSYNDLDSLARMYLTPIVWNEEGRHQYCADSIYAVVRGNTLEKANLLSSAFIHVQEDSLLFDQIRSTEMTAFFDGEAQLSRFDALGGVNALFYIEENGTYATSNKVDCKMMSALFKDGDIDRIYYFETAKNDASPIAQMKAEDKQFKGFSWAPDKRPSSRSAVTTLSLRPSERTSYSRIKGPKFIQTEIYFPGYIGNINRQIEVRDSLSRLRELQTSSDTLSVENSPIDSLSIADSLALSDSLTVVDSLALSDSLTVSDSLSVKDSLSVDQPQESFTQIDPKALKAAEKAAAKAARQKAIEEKWAAKDAALKAKEEAKAAKKKAKERAKKLKRLKGELLQDALDQEKLNRYIEKYRK